METPETFADPNILRALPRFAVSPEKYLPRLLVLQTRLEEELQKPRDQRTHAIYNDAYWKQTLDEAIAAARKSIQSTSHLTWPMRSARLRRSKIPMPSTPSPNSATAPGSGMNSGMKAS